MAWTSLCALDELIEGRGRYVEIEGFQLAVFRHAGTVHVLDNECPHAGGSLAGGHVEAGCAVCPWHHWRFSLETGELHPQGGAAIHTYRSRLLERAGASPLVQADLPTY